MNENENDKLIQQRLEDFIKILTYHIVKKIDYHFKGKYQLMYDAPVIWNKWRDHKLAYNKKTYDLILKFNNFALSAKQVQSIFGKDENGKWIAYEDLIKTFPNLKIFNKGTICMNDKRYQIKKRYILDIEIIRPIFEDKALHDKIVDASSDYYSKRQRRLIFTQINNLKTGYHYKTNAELSEEERINNIIEEMDI